MTYDVDTDLDTREDTITHKIIGVVGSPLYLAPVSTTDIYIRIARRDTPYNRYKNVVRFPLRQAETRLRQAETRLRQAETRLWQAETRLRIKML